MRAITTIDELRPVIKTWRKSGQSLAFVPTMGNLHAGHLQLIEEARKNANRVVVSIFVNPTQFGVGEDYETYPRTESEDQEKLEAAGVDVVFLPVVSEMYGGDARTVVSVTGLTGLHCGASRLGHFDGVATVVCKLFNIVQPDMAFFGEKDFQQLTIIRTMSRDLNFPVKIYGVATVREEDGLAMSSRNGYLTPEQRRMAPSLYQALCQSRDVFLAGAAERTEIEQQALRVLKQAGFDPEYFSICRSSDLKPASDDDSEVVILAAARLGKTRLIDNVHFSR
ncbi:MAG: pantoate--beta-alanine ligase [Gammaproteobacteria bacterium]